MSDPTKPGGSGNQKSVTKELENQEDRMQNILDIRTISVEQLREEKKLIREINSSLGQAFEAQKANYDILRTEITDFAAEFKKLSDEAGVMTEEQAKALSKQFEAAFDGNKTVLEELNEIIGDVNLSLDQKASKMETLKGELSKAERIGNEFNSGLSNMARSIGLVADASQTATGKIILNTVAIFKMQTRAARNEALNGMINSFQQMTNPMNLVVNGLQLFTKAAMEAYDATRQLNLAFGENLNNRLIEGSQELTKMGISMSEQAGLVSDLKDSIMGLEEQFGNQFVSIKRNAGTLKKLGVSVQDASSSFNLFTKGMAMNATEASNLNVAIAASAKNFGISSKKMMADFKAVSDSLAAHGKNMMNVFEGIQKQMVRTGLASEKLVTVASKFDKFSGAAETAAQMNALFGTSLSAMGMHTMDEAQRLDELQRQFMATGMSVDSLDRYQLKALAETLGVSVPEALQMMGGELTEDQKRQMALAETSEQLSVTMMELAQTMMPLLDQLKASIAAMFQHEDSIKAAVGAMETMAKMTMVVFNNLKTFIVLVASFKGLGFAAQMIMAAGGIKAMNTAMTMGVIGLLIMMASAMFMLYTEFHRTGSPAMYLLFGVIAAGIFLMGKAADVSKVGLLVLAVVALAVGASMLMIFYGLSMVIDSFTNMIVKTAEFADVIPILAFNIVALAGGLFLLGTAGMASMAGMVMASVGLFAILAAFALTGTSVSEFIQAGGDELVKIGQGIEAFGTGMEKIMSIAAKVKSAMGDSLMVASMEGSKMSVVVGKEGGVATLFKNDTLKISVDMPKIEIPSPNFNIYIDGKEIDARIEKRSIGNIR